jgi:hypothetical protein
MLQKGSHEGARETRHEAENPNTSSNRVHEHGRNGGWLVEGLIGQTRGSCSSRMWGSRELLRYLGKEDGVGVSL